MESLTEIVSYSLFACIFAFLWAPILTHILYKFQVIKGVKTELKNIQNHVLKNKTPVMGGLLVIVTVCFFTIAFNWSQKYTWLPIGVMLISASLGAIDDLLNIYGGTRRIRSLRQTFILIRVHKNILSRVWLVTTLPWALFKNIALLLGSHTKRGVYVHEKLFLQFLAGCATAWWIFTKLGIAWHSLNIPFIGDIYIGWLIVPFIIFVVMFTANAVNIADGMDGLAGGMLISTFGALTFLSWITGFQELAILNGVTAGSLMAYTYFNIKPARFMMGDVGSLGLGSLLAINSLAIGQNISLFFLGFMFYLEAITVIIQIFSKYVFNRKVFKMAPFHHHLELSGWSEEKTIMRFWIIHLIFVLIGVWISLQ